MKLNIGKDPLNNIKEFAQNQTMLECLKLKQPGRLSEGAGGDQVGYRVVVCGVDARLVGLMRTEQQGSRFRGEKRAPCLL